jgi:MFS family permease
VRKGVQPNHYGRKKGALMAGGILQNRWWAVFTTFTAGIVSSGAIMVFGTGVFLKPVGQELHFGRGVFSSALGLANVLTAIALPFVGRLMDRYGMRVVMLPLIVLFAISTAALSLLTASVALLMVLFAIQGFFAAVQGPAGFSKMVSARFDEKRGLALGIGLAGVGVGIIVLPQYARILMQHYGWRTGYLGLSVAIIILAFIPVAIFFSEPEEMKKDREMSKAKGRVDNPALPGVMLSEAARTGKYWALTIAIFLLMTVTNGVLVHMVPMLTDRGLSVKTAVMAMSISGAMVIIGRLIAGYLLDKIFAIYIAIFFLLVPMLGVGILISGATGWWTTLAVICVGLSLGAEFDLMAFIVSRYFGIRAFGALYGLVLMFVNFANAAGMMLMGWCFQIKHSYVPMLWVFEAFMVVSIVLMSRMGPYRYPALRKSAQKPAVAAASR